MRKRVGVDCVVDDRMRMRADFALDNDWVIKERRCSCGLSELRGELTEGEMLASSIDEAEGGDIPEHGGATVAEHDFVAVGKGKHFGQPIAQAAHHVLDGVLAMAGAEVVAARFSKGGNGLGANLRGATTEAAVGGKEIGGDGNGGWAHLSIVASQTGGCVTP